jgi:hypothetical protein
MRCAALFITAMLLVTGAGAARADTLAEMKAGKLPTGNPQALVRDFVDADAQGLQTSSDHWPLVRRFAVWADGPGWDTVTIVTEVEIGYAKIHGKRATVPVRYTVFGMLYDDGDFNPVLKPARKTTQKVTFRLVRRRDGWKIVAPQDGPRVSIPQLLDDRYKDYCETHDCKTNGTIQALRAEQEKHPFGIGVVR